MNRLFGKLFARRQASAVDVSQLTKCYTMALGEDGEAEITLYGEIVEETPRDWWTDEPIEGMYISLESFLQDLKTLEGAKNITIRIHSIGGDAAASIAIHNRIRELAKKASITVIVDGIAMSGGSLIMCAGDKVQVNPSSIIMIHKCWRLLIGGYNSTELRQIADSNDAYDRAQAAIYRKKTGMTDDELLALMENDHYMTGEEAVASGFADEVLDGDRLNIAASADRRTIYVDGRAIRLPMAAKKLPSSLKIPTITAAEADAIKNKPAKPGSEGGNTLMAKNLEELKKENPELAAAVEAEIKAAVTAAAGEAADSSAVAEALSEERKRIKEIDEIASMVNDDELVQEAKFGEKPCTAQELAFRAMKKQANQGEQHLEKAAEDYKASNASQVGAAANGGEDNPEDKVNAAVDVGIEAAKKAYGGK